MSDLVERLRAFHTDWQGYCDRCLAEMRVSGKELDAESETKMRRTDSGDAADEIERLRAALEPFRELSNEGNDDQPDDTPVTVHAGRSVCYWLTLADIRRVTAALARDKP